MANQIEVPLSVERTARVVFAATLSGIFLVAGTVTKNERAVFLTEGSGLPAKAFAAIVPPGAAVYRGPYAPYVGRDFSRGETPGGPVGRLISTPPSGRLINSPLTPPATPSIAFAQPGAGGTPGLPGSATVDPTQIASLTPSQFAPTVPQPGGGGAVGTPGGTTPETPSNPTTPTDPATPVTPTPTDPATPVTPTNPTTPTDPATPTAPATPTSPTTPETPTAAVPESATWEMLLAGFLVIGIALRRRSVATRTSDTGRAI